MIYALQYARDTLDDLFTTTGAIFPNMKGTSGLGNLPDAEVNENPGDIFCNLQMVAMLYSEAYKDRGAISSDFLYMKLGADITGNTIINSGDAEAKQLGWELEYCEKCHPG